MFGKGELYDKHSLMGMLLVYRKSAASCIGAFFAAVGVAYFSPPQDTTATSQLLMATESLVVDLIQATREVLGGSGCVHSYSHPLVKLIVDSGHAQLNTAVIIASPLLLKAASEWSGLQDKLVSLLDNMWDYFSRFVSMCTTYVCQ